jgi:hypothetical protein
MDLAWIAFFYLLRGGEHCITDDNRPLLLQDIGLNINNCPIDLLQCTMAQLELATASSLTFDTQKNRVRGEILGHTTSGHATACPTKALARRLHHLKTHGAGPTTPLCSVYCNGRWFQITSRMITSLLRQSVRQMPHLNYRPEDVSARSLRAGGAMALLCGGIDTNIIKLVGRWRSDAIFRYLHSQALPVVQNLANTMLIHGVFTLIPGSDLTPKAQQLLAQVPVPPVTATNPATT